MKSFRKILLASSLSVAAAALPVMPAASAAGCCGWEAKDASVIATTVAVEVGSAAIVTSIEEQTALLLFWLQQMTGQLSGNLKQQTSAEANMKTTQTQLDTKRALEQETYRAIVNATSGASTCNVVTGAAAGKDLEASAAAWREQLVQSQLDRDKGLSGEAKRGPDFALQKRLDAHCSLYADQNDVDSGACPSATTPSSQAGRNLNGDVLLNPTSSGSDSHNVISAADQKAVTMFIDTAMTSKPFGALPRDVAKTPTGKQLVNQRNASIARNSVGVAVAQSIFASKVPFGSAGSSAPSSVVGSSGAVNLADWAEGTASQTLGYKSSGNFPNGVSKDAWLELRAKAWHMNPNWAIAVDSDVVKAQKDATLIQAFQAYQNYENYKLLQQISLSLATMISIMETDVRSKM